MTPPELDDDHVVAICSALAEHDASYVVIGGVATRLHDTGHATVDIDVCPSRAKDNLARLATALRALGARLRVEGDAEGVAFEPRADLLANVTTMTLITSHGPLDLCFTPAGFANGYDELAPRAITVHLASVDVPVASLEDVVESKRAAGRPKDITALPALEAHLQRTPALTCKQPTSQIRTTTPSTTTWAAGTTTSSSEHPTAGASPASSSHSCGPPARRGRRHQQLTKQHSSRTQRAPIAGAHRTATPLTPARCLQIATLTCDPGASTRD